MRNATSKETLVYLYLGALLVPVTLHAQHSAFPTETARTTDIAQPDNVVSTDYPSTEGQGPPSAQMPPSWMLKMNSPPPLGTMISGTDWRRVRTDVCRQPAAEGFELNLPVSVDVRLLDETIKPGYLYNNLVSWQFFGSGLGIDFIWLKTNTLGFNISLKAGTQYRYDLGPEHVDEFSHSSDNLGVADFSFQFGLVY